jgi:cephalosporin hydroxylase
VIPSGIAGIAASVERWRRVDRPSYAGLPCQQFEEDLVRYAAIIHTLRPPWVIEVGRAQGGTARYLADHLQEARPGALFISIDVQPPGWQVPNVIHLIGDSVNPGLLQQVMDLARGGRGLVLLDGDHSPDQVLTELIAYARLANYLVVEDTIMGALGMAGPQVALEAWLPDHPEWVVDPDPPLTQHPGGYLRRSANVQEEIA